MDVDVEWLNVPTDDANQKTMFESKTIAVGYDIVTKSFFRKIKNFRKDGLNEYFGEDCVEFFVK